MEEIAGVSGALPPLVPYRTAAATNLPPQEWQACLDSWLVSIEARLRLADKQFSTLSLSDSGSGVPFLMSYFRRRPGSAPADLHQPMEVRLHQYSYLLTKRLLLGIPESNLLEQSAMLSFILEANANFNTVSEWRQTLGQSVFVQSPLFDSSLASWKALVGTALLSKPSSEWIEDLTRMNLLVKTLPRVGFELMKGADYLESLMHAFASSELPAAQTVVVENTYRSLLSLLSPEYTRPNSLMDQLHLLKSEASHFLRHLAASTALNSTKRGRDTINNLTEYPQSHRRNVFDDDAFDKLQISARQVHRGRKAIDIISPPSTTEEHNRQQLKRELGGGMTDEQIEGWAIMLSKDQSRQRRLEKQYSLTLGLAGGGGGNQRVLAPTKWSASRAAADDEAASEENPGDEDGDNKSGAATPTNRSAQSNKKSEHARQHGGFRSGGRGGRNTRREGRAKKMARGAFGGPPDAA
ncbi:hypothetical protein DV738_g5357, partial [Chaetothyriales sp. CBS 135597]